MQFKLESEFSPTGDQPKAIKELVDGINSGLPGQTLLGVTGSGKTFTVANVIQEVQRPTLILSHNKTLVAQLYGEFKHFFPNNLVEYFVSYYDYYQPEAYVPVRDIYIEKDLGINEEIDKLRMKTISSLLSGRKDVIVVASVSCIYGAGNPTDYQKSIIQVEVGQQISRNAFLLSLVDSLYSRTSMDFERGSFRVNGDVVDVYLAYGDYALRVSFFGDEIEEISTINPISGTTLGNMDVANIYPANIYVSPKDQMLGIINQIQDDMVKQVAFFKEVGKHLEAKRLEDRVTLDIEMMRELGYCSGIENYSRYLDGRNVGERPYCLMDYFPDDFLLVVDESHVTLPQVKAMYGGDRSRKQNLVEYGFRLPSAMDNRPLQFEEFEAIKGQTMYVSATPTDYEIKDSEGVVVEQLIRPTGLLDPVIEVRPLETQVDDLLEEVDERVKMGDRVLVTTLTKRMAEELTKYMLNLSVKCEYIHSEVLTIDRVEILRKLRLGEIDVLIGVNLLREGLDLPEVSLVAILDADKEGFLRSERALVQTIGRAARNVRGKVIMYADKITDSMRKTIDETKRRREIQEAYNKENGLVPQSVVKSKQEILDQTSVADLHANKEKDSPYDRQEQHALAADPVVQYMDKNALDKAIEKTNQEMKRAAKALDFMDAARLRDELNMLKSKRDELV
jgi:excinuclease ABC subunit B